MSNRQEKERRRQARLDAERATAGRAARRRRLRFTAATLAGLAAIALVVALAVASKNDSPTVNRPASPAPAADASGGVPRQIAANSADANKVVDGSIATRLSALRGVPVVVNQWASWCPNCKQEFPFFQRLAQTYARRVAFVGLDSQDERGAAQAFLRSFPVSYPSLYDPRADQARSIGGGQGWPTTFYYDRTGRQTYVRPGGYTTIESLKADIERFALGRPA
jgi:cytochrome c biogenesis protein CcmG, thiol:disulfide interchange protein DsbE